MVLFQDTLQLGFRQAAEQRKALPQAFSVLELCRNRSCHTNGLKQDYQLDRFCHPLQYFALVRFNRIHHLSIGLYIYTLPYGG